MLVAMKKICRVASAGSAARQKTTAKRAQPTMPVHQVCTLLRPARRIAAPLNALALISKLRIESIKRPSTWSRLGVLEVAGVLQQLAALGRLEVLDHQACAVAEQREQRRADRAALALAADH